VQRTGGVRGRSCFTAARLHLGKKAVSTRDVTDCYPSVTREQFRRKLLSLGFRSDSAFLLSGLLTCRDRIPQGSPASNDALNIYLFDIDQMFFSACGTSLSFTRNADDHVISGNDIGHVGQTTLLLEVALQSNGLVVNEMKKAENGLRLAPDVQLVHKILVNHPKRTRINADFAKKFNELGERYLRAAETVNSESLEHVALLRLELAGSINYSRQADLSPARHLKVMLERGDRFVQKKLSAAKVTRSKKWWVKKKFRNRPAEYTVRWKKLVEEEALDQSPEEPGTD
jgi:hypothetical protein